MEMAQDILMTEEPELTIAAVKRILLIDDNAEFRQALVVRLRNVFPAAQILEYDLASSGEPGPEFPWQEFDLVILDYYLGDGNTGVDWLRRYKNSARFPATIVLTGAGEEAIAVEVMQSGAHNYLNKSKLSKQRICTVINDVLAAHAAEVANADYVELQKSSRTRAAFLKKLDEAVARHSATDQFGLVLVKLDDHERLGIEHGALVPYNIISHMAGLTFHAFRANGIDAILTRIDESSVALLYRQPKEDTRILTCIDNLHKTIPVSPYVQDGVAIEFSVSVGVLPALEPQGDARLELRLVRQACMVAAKAKGNSCHVHTG